MRFLALAALLVAADSANIPRQRLNKRMIMEKAIRVNSKGERLLAQRDFELSGGYSLQFSQCVSLKTEPYLDQILFDESLIAYTSKGQVMSQMSYILFNVCETEFCEYYVNDDNLYMVDINTYMEAISTYYQDMREEYCGACVDSANYCSYAAYQKSKGQQATYKQYYYTFRAGNQQEESATEVQQGEQDEQQQNQNGGRMLEQLYKKIDCETCGVFGCFREDTTEEGSDAEAEGNEDYQYNEVNTENIAAWVDAIGKCKKTDALLDDLWPLYAGFMCNENGSGVDIALFLDEDCTVYTSRQSFKKVANANDQAYMYEAEDMITYPFKNDISCQTEVEYLSYHDYFDMQMNYNYQNNNNNNQNYGDANDFCQNMFEDGGEGKALSLRDCNQDGDEDDQETDAQVNYYSYDYYWYDFVLSYQDSLDLEATCMVLQSMNGEYESVYKYSGSGGIYDYSNSKSSKRNSRSHYEDYFASVGTMEAEVIAAIVSAVAVAVLVLGCIIRSCLCKNGVEKKYGEKYEAHMEALEKKRCLVDDKTGSMLM